ncbi:uncharacterized protein LOC124356530 [Homalodisca vitripennis]|uniref:uncharacterized protein LOC124356530 n=1 Tax=Homalodisca vitripennis TaxID=197043 RepID=UPI001EEC1281|nr:uncharacterized protein LOC124356530 [Homalodisca vitripennis]
MEEPNIPDWLTADFLKSCLESDEENKEGVVINSYNAESAVPPGNNYGSNILRVKIVYQKLFDSAEYSISLIIKAPLVVGGFVEQFGDLFNTVYLREAKYYNEFITESYKLMKHNIVPRNYKSPNPLCVVLEDLKRSGYVMVDKQKLLDFDHCQLYIKASANLHALTIAVHKTHPDIIESLVKENPTATKKTVQVYKNVLRNLFLCMATYLEDKKEYKEFEDFFRDISEGETFFNIYREVEKTKSRLTAVIQKDPWCTNMMFKYNSSGDVLGVKLFDFQNLKFVTPLRELITFVWTSANPEVREKKLHELYQIYCDSLNCTFKQLGCSERLSIEELKEEILFLSPLVIVTVCALAPFCLADEAVNVSDFLNANSPDVPIKESHNYRLYQGTTFNKYYPQIINQIAKEGIFEHIKQKMKHLSTT